jgi:hypothetical protein
MPARGHRRDDDLSQDWLGTGRGRYLRYGVPIRPTAPIGQSFNPTVLIALKELVAGVARGS